ncbi:MAG: hypothetical protein FWC71_07400 [Defluviitaleaceae bacterium]|nr:hypothetical protein [Defluviitaleaceae bacterium]
MEGKELFTLWAPQDGYAWTRYAKPALFMHPPQSVGEPTRINPLPQDLAGQLHGGKTAVIVDLIGAAGVAAGLDLTGMGFRPVPLYNGIHQQVPAPGRRNAVDNQPIIDALHNSASVMQTLSLPANAPPAFILDAARNENLVPTLDIYDNRWTLDLDDMPDFMYMRAQGISRVIIWTDRAVQEDLKQIAGRYQSAGIEVFTYMQAAPVTDAELTGAIRKFEFAKYTMRVIFGIAMLNILGMFIFRGEPFLWTAPTVMWLTYLWVPESVGDIIALILAAGYLGITINLTNKRQQVITIALAVVALETVILFVYAAWYGLAAYTGYSFLYGLVVFGVPVTAVFIFYRAWRVLPLVIDLEPARYAAIAETLYTPHMRTGFRGFRGYGGRGYGGYGGGYGGYGGFGG